MIGAAFENLAPAEINDQADFPEILIVDDEPMNIEVVSSML